jgi:outer membrane protein assembly factor BamB
VKARLAGATFVMAALFAGAAERPASWAQWLGPSRDGSVAAPGTFRGRTNLKLTEAWRRPAPSALAGVLVADGRAVTLVSDGENDDAVAFAVADGRELWRTRLDASVPGADRGPGSTPALDGGRVFALSPACQLRGLDAATGKVVWHRDLKKDFAVVLRQGCGTSPLVESGTVIVQGGGRENDQRVIGLDAATGETRWVARGPERTFYTTPTVADIGGVRQIVVHHTVPGTPNKGGLIGLRWDDRSVLWSHAFEQMSFETPIALPGGQVLLSTWNDAHLLRVSSANGSFAVQPVWKSSAFRSYVSPPVHHEGYLYGFGDDFLSCVKVADGSVAWKEKLYVGSLILVDGHLVVQGVSTGLLRVAEASPAGYREKAQLAVFNRGSRAEAPPSFAEGRIFVRNDEEIVAVTIEAPARSR